MPAPAQYPYDTRLNILHKQLELIDEKALSDAAPDTWYNQTLCQVNGSVVRLGVFHGEYHWHKHDEDDEFFYVMEGQLLIDLPQPRSLGRRKFRPRVHEAPIVRNDEVARLGIELEAI